MKRADLLYVSDLILEVEDRLSKHRDFDYESFICEKCRQYRVTEAEDDIIRIVERCKCVDKKT